MDEQIGAQYYTLRNFAKTIEDFGKTCRKVKETGLYFGYHNHSFEFVKFDGKFIMDRLIEESNLDTVRFIVDTYWLQYGGVNPVDFIKN